MSSERITVNGEIARGADYLSRTTDERIACLVHWRDGETPAYIVSLFGDGLQLRRDSDGAANHNPVPYDLVTITTEDAARCQQANAWRREEIKRAQAWGRQRWTYSMGGNGGFGCRVGGC